MPTELERCDVGRRPWPAPAEHSGLPAVRVVRHKCPERAQDAQLAEGVGVCSRALPAEVADTGPMELLLRWINVKRMTAG